MYKIGMKSFALGAFLLLGCAGQAKTDSTVKSGEAVSGDEASEPPAEHRMPESPKMKADDMAH